jgi:tRNA modification GTPase
MVLHSTSKDTIFALSSAAGRAGVAVVRVSGAKAGDVVEALCGDRPEPRSATLRKLVDPQTGGMIDQGLVLWFPGPASFTGEGLAEFHVHGGRAVVAALIAALGRFKGCRMAEPGEFALRAFENGKIDLSQAEGLADLIDAETEAQRVQAVRQAGGALSRLTEQWRGRLIEAMGLVEAAIDFSDEADVADGAVGQAEARAGELASEISRYLDDGHGGEILRDGLQVVLAGAPNSGKSSLLNALARRDVAIVSSEAGTTRDIIEVHLDLEGLPVVVSDTAGLREASGDVEREGVRRTRARVQDADLVIWVLDGSAECTREEAPQVGPNGELLVLFNKCDLDSGREVVEGPGPGELRVSAKTGEGLGELIKSVAVVARRKTGAGEDAVITRTRHRQHLADCCRHLATFLGKSSDVELRAEDLRLAADALGRISGRVDPEDVLGEVFGRFCIGK